MLVIHNGGLLAVGVHQVRQQLGAGVKRNRFQLALYSNKDESWPAMPDEERQLKLHAGYSPHSSNVKVISIRAAYHALKKLKVLSAGGEAAFQHLMQHGVKYLTPVSAQQRSREGTGDRPGAAAPAAAATAASGGTAEAPPASGAREAPGSSAAAAAAAGCSHLPFTELPTLNMSKKQQKLLSRSKYGLATVAPHLMYAEPLVGQFKVRVHSQYNARACTPVGTPSQLTPSPIMPAGIQGVEHLRHQTGQGSQDAAQCKSCVSECRLLLACCLPPAACHLNACLPCLLPCTVSRQSLHREAAAGVFSAGI